MIHCPEHRLTCIRCILLFHAIGLLFLHAFSQEANNQTMHTSHHRDTIPFIFRKAILPIPFLLYNAYDKFQPAIAFTSLKRKSQLQKLFIAPSYSFHTNHLNIIMLFHLRQKLHTSHLGLEHFLHVRHNSYMLVGDTVLRYAFFSYEPMLSMTFGLKTITFSLSPMFYGRDKLIWNNHRGIYETTKEYAWFLKIEHSLLYQLQSGIKCTTNLTADVYSDFLRTALEQQFFVNYKQQKRGIRMRLFAGTFLRKTFPTNVDGRFRLSGITGIYDFRFEHIYIARSDYSFNFFANQMYQGDGFFKARTPLGQTWKWLSALNVAVDFPTFLPLQWYVDVGTYAEAFDFDQFQDFPFNSGIAFVVLRDVLTLYIPLLFSKDIKQYYTLNNINFVNRISWSFEFKNIRIPDYKKRGKP